MKSRRPVALLALGAALGLLPVTAVAAPTSPSTPTRPAAVAPRVGTTSAVEARRVDRVPVKIGWYTCYSGLECAMVGVPLDYDRPAGATTQIAVLRHRATDQKHRIGTLFVNPGGPGGSGVLMAQNAEGFLSKDVLARFDVVGFDPRGINYSQQVHCFAGPKAQAAALPGYQLSFPVTVAEQATYLASSARLGKGCATTGAPLTLHASTAEVARDLDVLRRGVGDKQLSYLGFSYGTYLGQVYANLFPDRVRAMVIDGVLDPLEWRGTPANKDIPVTLRLDSDLGAWQALQEIWRRCDAAGPSYCPMAGNSMARFDQLARRLAAAPLVSTGEDGSTSTLSYADFVGITLSLLYSPHAGDLVAGFVQQVEAMANPATTAAHRAAAARQVQATRTLVRSASTAIASSDGATAPRGSAAGRVRGFDFPYDNGVEAFTSVLCTDSLNPVEPGTWPMAIAARSRAVPYFSEAWGWSSAACAGRTWTARDPQAYAGGFTATTAHPVLVVGNYRDPATNYHGAQVASQLLGGARLLSSDSWGHTAYGTSPCTTQAVDGYLLTGALPAQGTVCIGPQPFTEKLDAGQQAAGKRAPQRITLPGVPLAPHPHR